MILVSVEDQIKELDEKTAYAVSDVTVSGAFVAFHVDAAPDISLFSTADRLGLDIHAVRYISDKNVYRCRAVDHQELET